MSEATNQGRLEDLFAQALQQPADQRARFLDDACADDPALREELAALLDAHIEAPAFFDQLAAEIFAPAPIRAEDPMVDNNKTVAHYRILEKLGGGGMGVVYKAYDTRLDRPVALKFLTAYLRDNDDAKARFIHEAKAASALDHPNIATIHEIGESSDGRLFIAMAYYQGETLKEKIARGSLSVDEALDLALQITRGLHSAHAHGIVHRDVKPANIMVAEPAPGETGNGLVKIVDFGLAKVADVRLTETGTTLGTVAYMSPEQTHGDVVDARTDLWSLGVVLYEMLTGRLPFRGDYDQAIVYSILNEDPPPLTDLQPGVPPALAAVVARCLAKEPDARYPNAAALLADLGALQPSVQASAPLRYVPRLIGGAAVVILALLGLWLLSGNRPGLPAEKHLAVLPFSYEGTDSLDQGFCDGMTELLSTQLQQLTRLSTAPLWVISPREVADQAVHTPAEAHRVLGANLTVSGVCQRRPENQMRVFLTLEDAVRLRLLDSDNVTAPLSDQLAFQDGIISRLAAMMETNLGPDALQALTAGGTQVSEAFALYVRGRAYLERFDQPENVEAAIRLFEQAVRQDPDYALAHAGLGEAYWRKYEDNTLDAQWSIAAGRSLERAVQLDDRIAAARVFRAVMYRETGDFEAAHREVQHALTVDPRNDGAYRELARLYRQEGKQEEALTAYGKAIELRPEYWFSYRALGDFYRSLGRYEDAQVQYEKIIQRAPDNYWGYYGLGLAHYDRGDLDESSRIFEKALGLHADYVAYWYLGLAHLARQRYPDAARAFEQALALNNRSSSLWANLGRAYKWIPTARHKADSTFRQAAERAEAALAANPNDATIQLPLAEYYANLGDSTRAYALLRNGLAGAALDVDLMFRAALVFEQLARRDEALRWVAQALEAGYSRLLIEQDPEMGRLRADPRYQELLQKIAADSLSTTP